MSVTTALVSAACNCVPDVVACSQDNVVAFGADLSILLYQLQVIHRPGCSPFWYYSFLLMGTTKHVEVKHAALHGLTVSTCNSNE